MHRSAQRRASQSVVDALGARGPLTCCLCCGTLFFGLDRIPAYCNQPVVGFSQNCLIELGPFAVNCSRARHATRARAHTHTHTRQLLDILQEVYETARTARSLGHVPGCRISANIPPTTWNMVVPGSDNLEPPTFGGMLVGSIIPFVML